MYYKDIITVQDIVVKVVNRQQSIIYCTSAFSSVFWKRCPFFPLFLSSKKCKYLAFWIFRIGAYVTLAISLIKYLWSVMSSMTTRPSNILQTRNTLSMASAEIKIMSPFNFNCQGDSLVNIYNFKYNQCMFR